MLASTVRGTHPRNRLKTRPFATVRAPRQGTCQRTGRKKFQGEAKLLQHIPRRVHRPRRTVQEPAAGILAGALRRSAAGRRRTHRSMKDKHSRDPWMDRPHDAMAAWERSLRPTKSSSLMWQLIGVAVAAGVACLIFSSWPGAGPVRRATERPGTSAPSPGATAPATPATRMDPQPPHEPAAPRTQSFAKCISAAGAVTYSDGACRQGTRAAAVTVNPDLNLADGMSDA